MAAIDDLGSQRFYHGTKADLKPGDLIGPGHNSNYVKRKNAAYVYLTATLDAATWGAELALGAGPGRIYIGLSWTRPSDIRELRPPAANHHADLRRLPLRQRLLHPRLAT